MKLLTTFKRSVFALVFAVVGVISWGQTLSDLSGNGSVGDPYQIKNHTDWNTLASVVNGGNNCSGLYFVLKESITLTIDNTESSDIIVGIWNSDSNYKPFSGTFDGDWHTITFNVGDNTTSYTPAFITPSAPFGVITGATIKNLTVTGTIRSTQKYNSGLVGFSFGTQSNIIRCTSDITINCEGIGGTNPDCSSAGFLAENKSGGSIRFLNCVFSGTITKGNLDNANRCAGFVSYNNNDNTVVIDTCTMAGTIDFTSNIATFDRGKKVTRRKAYYITNYSGSSPQGTPATTTEPTDGIAKKYTKNANTYYVPGAKITGLEETVYQYTGNDIVITPVVKYYGQTLTKNTDYTISYEKKNGSGDYETVSTIKDVGDYHFIISGVGNYGGSIVTDMKVIQLNSWAALMEALSQNEGTFDLTQNITAKNPRTTDLALQVTGNITLNMHGYTIDRNLEDTIVYGQVIRVNEGASLTINGPGIIKGGYNWPGEGVVPKETTYWPKRDGGGIHNMGNLVLNNVDVIDNKCYKEEDGSTNPTARGGGIYSGAGSSLIINGGSVSSNIGRGGGGGVYCDKANPFVMTGVEVWANGSDSKGGGLRIKTGSAVAYLTDCDISNWNYVSDDASQGGGIYMEAGELVMTRCTISANASTMQGGGFFSKSGKTTAIDCSITNNGTNNFDSGLNYGGGVCLNDNKGADHSIYIMDGGIISNNNSELEGGGIYVYDGAVFQVKGDVQIVDNLQAGYSAGLVGPNNAYLTGSAVIEVVGPLGDDAIINITPHDGGGVAVEFADGASSGSLAEDLSHFTLDGSDYNLIIDEDGIIESYVPSEWNNTDTWNGTIAEATNLDEGIPTSSSTIEIHRAVKIPSGVIANAGTIYCDDFCDIIIEDGAQLLTNSSGVAVMAKKEIKAATAKTDATGWYLISSPVANPSITGNTNLITITGFYDDPSYDLYRYNEAADLQWENYRAGHADFTTLENGRGYLYRNKNDYTINVGGTLHVSDVSYALSYNATTSPSGTENTLRGFNIIGNPYSHNVYKGAEGSAIPNGDLLEDNYYMLNPTTGEWDLTVDGTVIPPMTGILVQAKSSGILTMTNSTEGEVVSGSKSGRANRADSKNIWFTVANSNYEDRTCVEFREGHGLNKIEHLNGEAPMLYIHHNGEDFASVDMNPEAKMFNLNFEAKTMGYYTLSVKPHGEFGYLHLIDRVTEKEIDLLEEQEYTFIGSTSDAANRFIVCLGLSDNPEVSDNEVFAYQNGNDIIVAGEGELEVFDVMGRMVMKRQINGIETVCESSLQTGVYILRLEEKTQKIVVR